MAAMTAAEKKAFIAGLDPEVRKAMRNEFLLAQATASVPTSEDGIFALIQRTGRRVIGA